MANDLRVQAALVTAAFELSVVKGIRGAIRVNLLRRGGREGPLGNIENPKPPPSLPNFGEQRHAGQVERPPVLLDALPPRLRPAEPTDRCGCRSTPRATDAVPRLSNLTPTDITLPTTDAERASGLPSRHDSPLAPPWQMPLPVATPPPTIPFVKCRAARPDGIAKGQMLDLFT